MSTSITTDFTASEDLTFDANVQIGQVLATDADGLGRIDYTGGNNEFVVNPFTGIVQIRQPSVVFNFERQ